MKNISFTDRIEVTPRYPIEIIATLLPDCEKGHFRLVLNPHLSQAATNNSENNHPANTKNAVSQPAQADSLRKSYPIICDWYKYIELFKNINLAQAIQVEFFNDDFIPIGGSQALTLVSKKHIDATLWSTMFPDEVVVQPWKHDFNYDLVSTITSSDISKRMADVINALIKKIQQKENIRVKDGMHLHSSQRDIERYGSFLVHLQHFEKKILATHRHDALASLLGDPIFSDFTNPMLHELFVELKNINDDYLVILEDLLLKVQQDNKEKKPDVPDIYNEFHKLFSVYSYHPNLLEHTGWIWEYKLNGQLPTEENGYIKVKINIDDDTVAEQLIKDLLKNQDSPNEDEWRSFLLNVTVSPTLTYMNFKTFLAANRDDIKNVVSLGKSSKYYLQVATADYKIVPYLVDRKKVLQKIGDVVNKFNAQTASTAAANVDLEKNSNEGTEYISTGITVAIHSLQKLVDQKINANPDANKNFPKKKGLVIPEGSTGLAYAYNIQHGYLIDVIGLGNFLTDTTPRKRASGQLRFSSISYREEEYTSLKTEEKFNKDAAVTEGIVIESLQRSNSGKLYVDEELFHWNDWGLAAPLPGVIENQSKSSAPLQISVRPHVRKEDAEDTIENYKGVAPLRFGNRYAFGIRLSNIAGIGPKSIEDTIDKAIEDGTIPLTKDGLKNHLSGKTPMDVFTTPIRYQRVDAINSPVVHTATIYSHDQTLGSLDDDFRVGTQNTDKDKKWVKGREGEDLYNLVIRSQYIPGGEHGDGALESMHQHSSRLIGPPKTSLSFVMQHGVLDELLHEAQSDPHKMKELRKEILIRVQPEVLRFGITGSDEVLKKHAHIEYLYDPLANGFSFRVDKLEQNIDCEYAAGGKKNAKRYWHDENGNNQRYYTITLKEPDEREEQKTDFIIDLKNESEEGCAIFLKQGCEKEILIGCSLRDDNDDFFEVPPFALFMDGIRKANYTLFKVTHAVQKPCLINLPNYTDYKNIDLKKEVGKLSWARDPSDQTKDFLDLIYCNEIEIIPPAPLSSIMQLNHISFAQFPVLTSGGYTLHVRYLDIVCDITAENGFAVVVQERAIESSLLPVDATNETDVVFLPKPFGFKDTRYKQATFWIEAASRFKKYFPESPAGGFNITGLCHKEISYKNDDDRDLRTVLEKASWFPVKNTKAPKIPAVFKMLPVMKWEDPSRKNKNLASYTVKRFCHKIRVYFKDWYDTGYDEQLAVLFLPDVPNLNYTAKFNSSHTLHIDNYVETSVSHLISQLGKDPTAHTIEKDGVTIIEYKCFIGCEGPELKNIKLSDIGTGANVGIYPDSGGDLILNAAAYKINFNDGKDEEQGIIRPDANDAPFYVDITLDDEFAKNADDIINNYMPFVRFALARYQPNSIFPATQNYSCSVSAITLTDFCQLLPYREVRVDKQPAVNTWKVLFIDKVQRKNGEGMSTNRLYYQVNAKPGTVACLPTDTEPATDIFAMPEKDTATTAKNTLTITCNEQGEIITINGIAIKGSSVMILEYEDHSFGTESVGTMQDPRYNKDMRLVFAYEFNQLKEPVA